MGRHCETLPGCASLVRGANPCCHRQRVKYVQPLNTTKPLCVMIYVIFPGEIDFPRGFFKVCKTALEVLDADIVVSQQIRLGLQLRPVFAKHPGRGRPSPPTAHGDPNLMTRTRKAQTRGVLAWPPDCTTKHPLVKRTRPCSLPRAIWHFIGHDAIVSSSREPHTHCQPAQSARRRRRRGSVPPIALRLWGLSQPPVRRGSHRRRLFPRLDPTLPPC